MNAPFEQLPSELNIRIFEYLSVNELCLCLRVDRNWNRWIQDADYLWQNKLRQLSVINMVGRTSRHAEKISKMVWNIYLLWRSALVLSHLEHCNILASQSPALLSTNDFKIHWHKQSRKPQNVNT